MYERIGFILLFIFSGITPVHSATHLVVFSFNRPLQLYAFLESAQRYISGEVRTTVLYRATDERFCAAYDIVNKAFPQVIFVKQGKVPRQDFKPTLLSIISDHFQPYIIFAVDDIVITDYINLDKDIILLEKSKAYGFYYRLGKNIKFHYMKNTVQYVPRHKAVERGIYIWCFKDANSKGYWKYPHTVDMALYRTKEIMNFFENLDFTSPNTLESAWHNKYASAYLNKSGLFFEKSKAVNIPLNCVQQNWKTKNMNLYSPEVLLIKFNQGLKLNIDPVHNLKNRSAHVPYNPTFIKR